MHTHKVTIWCNEKGEGCLFQNITEFVNLRRTLCPTSQGKHPKSHLTMCLQHSWWFFPLHIYAKSLKNPLSYILRGNIPKATSPCACRTVCTMLFISSPGTPGMLEKPWILIAGCVMEDRDVVDVDDVDVDWGVAEAEDAGGVLVVVDDCVGFTPICR